MGLLSRLGRGLTQAAPIMGQMAQASMLAEADEKKYQRLLKREEKAFERLTSAADTKWERDLDLLARKEKQAIAAAQSEGQLDYFKGRLDDQKAVILKLEEKLEDYLTVGQFEQIDPEMRERKFAAFNSALERLKSARETYNALDAQYRVKAGLPPSIGLETEEFDINAAVNMAAEEIYRSGEEEGATGLISVPTMTDQVKSINDMLERNKMPIMTPEQETSFRELVEAQVRGIGGQQMPDQVSAALGLKPEVSIYERQKAEAAARDRVPVADVEIAPDEEGPLIYPGVSPGSIGVDFPRLGEAIVSGAKAVAPYLAWKGGVGGKPRGNRLLKAVEDEASDDSIAKILETDKKDALRNLNSIISREFEESTYQATTVLGAIMALLNAGWDVERVINEIKSAEKAQGTLGLPVPTLDETSFNTPDDAMIRDLIDSFSKPARV